MYTFSLHASCAVASPQYHQLGKLKFKILQFVLCSLRATSSSVRVQISGVQLIQNFSLLLNTVQPGDGQNIDPSPWTIPMDYPIALP